MRSIGCVLLMCVAFVGGAWGANPVTFVGPSGPSHALAPNRDACWSEPPDLDGQIASSEIIAEYGFESELANDFHLDQDATITLARWWGGYFNNIDCEESHVASVWNLAFYDDNSCEPGNLLAEFVIPDFAAETLVYCQAIGCPVFRYEGSISFPATANTRYWFVAQAGEHVYPPQVGRIATATITDCSTMMRSEALSWSDWYSGPFFDSSQEFECGVVPTKGTTWGTIRGLYR